MSATLQRISNSDPIWTWVRQAAEQAFALLCYAEDDDPATEKEQQAILEGIEELFAKARTRKTTEEIDSCLLQTGYSLGLPQSITSVEQAYGYFVGTHPKFLLSDNVDLGEQAKKVFLQLFDMAMAIPSLWPNHSVSRRRFITGIYPEYLAWLTPTQVGSLGVMIAHEIFWICQDALGKLRTER